MFQNDERRLETEDGAREDQCESNAATSTRDTPENQAICSFEYIADAEILIGKMRVAVCWLALLRADIEDVAVTLKAGRISPSGALRWLHQYGVADFVLNPDQVAT